MNPINLFRVLVHENGEIKTITVTSETLQRLYSDPNVRVLGYMESLFDEPGNRHKKESF